MKNKINISVEEIFKKHYKKKTGKDADNVVMHYMGYCFEAMNEYADLKCAHLIKRIEEESINSYKEGFNSAYESLKAANEHIQNTMKDK